ncbi:MAG TPA: hypothetical protein VMR14_05990 [Streptosporangiaceae bacterium]|nr:hypothetical protein [Streptosporangiaceae bacterium]
MRYKRVLRGAPVIVPALLVAMSMTAQAQGATSQASGTSSRAASAQSGWRPLTSALAKQLSRNVSDKVIVVLRNQLRSVPDTPANSARRRAAVSALQKGVIADLTATHSRDIKAISLVNAVAATVSVGEAKRLAADPAVAQVVPDLPIPIATSSPIAAAIKAARNAPGASKPLPNACTSGKTVQLDPEAIEAIHAASQSGKGNTAQALGYTGAGVKVAWIADGLDPDNPDFIRANGKHVFVDYQDFSGTGTSAPTDGAEAFLDASSIAAQGREVYNVQNYGFGLTVPCRIRILGVAPGASLVGLNVFGSADVAFNSVFLEAINYAVTVDHVNVINESFGSNPFPDTSSLDLTKEADNAAVKAGVTVTVSSGDAGPTNTIGSAATDPEVISAGASTTYRAYDQTGIAGITFPGVKGWLDDNISGLSSGGFDQAGGTVDVVAPGDLNWALCTPKPKLFAACTTFSGKPASVELQGGTSEASPLTAGVAALVIQAYAESHHGHHPSPAVVKKIIVSTAQNIAAPAEQQGAGLIDAYAAVLAARSYAGGTQSKAGHAVLASSTQLNAVEPESTSENFADTLTNDGSGSETVHLSSRTLSGYTTTKSGELDLTRASGYVSEVKFTVAAGQARLNVSAAMPSSAVNISLIAPNGDFADNNDPQGFGNFGSAQVADPEAGTWTAIVNGEPLSTVATLKTAFAVSTATWQPFGDLSASSVTLAAGASTTIHLAVSTPAAPGDQSGSILVHTSAETTSIPVTLRSMVPAPDPTVDFSGTLTGGNGRQASTGQTDYYEVDLPSGEPALNVSLGTDNASNTVFAELVDPAGEAVTAGNNGLLATTSSGSTELEPEEGTNLHVLNPVAGVWTLIIDFYNTVSGTAVSQPFDVSMNVTPTHFGTVNVPNSTAIHLTAGQPDTMRILLQNPSSQPEEYFVDPRLDTSVTETLAPQTTSQLQLPNLAGIAPTYLVPPLTTRLTAKVTAPAVNFFDLAYAFGDPDLISSEGKTSALTFSAPDIANGDWTVTPFLKGPDGAKGAKAVTATVSVSATTAPVDPTITSTTGDLWASSTDLSAALTPVVVPSGQGIVITVTITPKGTPGTVVSGTLYLDDLWFNPSLVTSNDLTTASPTSGTIAAIPYEYTIGS